MKGGDTMFNANPYFINNNNPYMQRLNQMEAFQQQSMSPASNMASAQPIQTIQSVQQPNPQSICYFVSSKDELQNLQINPNTLYIGINRKTKEIYTRSWNNDGIIDFDTYSLAEGKQEQSLLNTIMTKLENIENKLKERDHEWNVTANNAKGDGRTDAEQPSNGSFQSNDAGKVVRPANADAY